MADAPSCRVALSDREIGAQVSPCREVPPRAPPGLALPSIPGVALRGEAPAEHVAGEDLEIVDHRLGLTLGPEGPLVDALREQPLTGGVTAVEDRSAADQRRRGEDQAGRLHEAEPLEVREDLGIGASVMASIRVRP